MYPSVIDCWVQSLRLTIKNGFKGKGVGHFWGKWEVLLCFLKSAYLQGDAASLSHLSSTLTTHSTHHLHFIMAQWISSIHQILHIPPEQTGCHETGCTTFRQGTKLVAMNWLHNPSGRLRRGVQGSYIHSHSAPSLAKIIGPKTRPQAQSKTHSPETTEKSKQLKKKSKMKKQTRKTREHQKQKKQTNKRNNEHARKQTI